MPGTSFFRRVFVGPAIPGEWSRPHTLAVFLIPVLVILVGCCYPAGRFGLPWAITMALLAFFILLAGHGIVGLWRGALIDGRRRISLSRLQLCLWTVFVLAAYVVAVLRNLAHGASDPAAVAVPEELWFLMGISVTSLVGSSLIKDTKRDTEPAPQEAVIKITEMERRLGVSSAGHDGRLVVLHQSEEATWRDLFMGEETGNCAQLDLGKVQMFFFTVILLISYGAALTGYVASLPVPTKGQPWIASFPALSEGMVWLLGISHAGYLTYKAVPHSRTEPPAPPGGGGGDDAKPSDPGNVSVDTDFVPV